MRIVALMLGFNLLIFSLGAYVGHRVSEKKFIAAVQEAGVGDCLLGHLLLPILPKEVIP